MRLSEAALKGYEIGKAIGIEHGAHVYFQQAHASEPAEACFLAFAYLGVMGTMPNASPMENQEIISEELVIQFPVLRKPAHNFGLEAGMGLLLSEWITDQNDSLEAPSVEDLAARLREVGL